jgi:hypothetical protein
MKAPEPHIVEFQELCRTECGVDLTVQEAYDYYERAMDLYRAIYRPIPQAPENHKPP